jgi:16S rRNA (uracil1498-N3)-methyltransferase
MRANTIEAAQQCGVLAVPEVVEPVPIKSITGKADADRLLVFCDEDAEVKDPVAALAAARPRPSALLPADAARASMPLAVLIGPEGGFAEEERRALLARPNLVRISLGPLILREPTS